MGTLTAPVSSSGSCPSWIALVAKPSFFAAMIPSLTFMFSHFGEMGRSGRPSPDAHLRRDEAAPKMGHPGLGEIYFPPFAVRLRRMGHPSFCGRSPWGYRFDAKSSMDVT